MLENSPAPRDCSWALASLCWALTSLCWRSTTLAQNKAPLLNAIRGRPAVEVALGLFFLVDVGLDDFTAGLRVLTRRGRVSIAGAGLAAAASGDTLSCRAGNDASAALSAGARELPENSSAPRDGSWALASLCWALTSLCWRSTTLAQNKAPLLNAIRGRPAVEVALGLFFLVDVGLDDFTAGLRVLTRRGRVSIAGAGLAAASGDALSCRAGDRAAVAGARAGTCAGLSAGEGARVGTFLTFATLPSASGLPDGS